MTRFLLIIAVGLAAVRCYGQSAQIDSLKQLLHNSKGDWQKLQATLALVARQETLPKDTLFSYALKAKALALKLHDMPARSMAAIAIANAYLRWNNADSARAAVAPELSRYTPGNPATRDIYFKLQLLQIDCLASSANYKNAIEDSYMLLREAEKDKDSLAVAECLNSISGYKYEMGFPEQAVALALRGLSFTSAASRYSTAVINLSGNLAEYDYWLYKLDSAMQYADRTLALARRTGYVNFQSWAWQKRSAIYLKTKAYGKSEKAILEAAKLDEKIDGHEPHDDNLIALADVYRITKRYDRAIKVLTDGLSYYDDPRNVSPHAGQTAGTGGLQRIFYYKLLARCYRLKGDSKNYEAVQERIITGLDNFYIHNSGQAIAEFETKYQLQKKEATIARQQLALVRGNYLFYGSVVAGLLGGMIAFFIFWEIRASQKLKLSQLHEDERLLSEKAVAGGQVSERRRIAADLHENLGAQLSFIKRNVNFMMDQPAGFSIQEERKYLSSVNDIAQSAMIDLRETLWVLNKDEVDIQEFADKLKSYLKQQLAGNENIKSDFQEHIGERWLMSSADVMQLFRIVQEVISNIIKHAGAEQIYVRLSSSKGTYQLEIADNGKGFDLNNRRSDHFGLEGIQNRAKVISAEFSMTSRPGSGTRIVLTKK